ncbi:MAG: hypothetical protein KatS3mg112_0527 [Thermogutta sp.]|nr:MAG: hypothetical protein KatS3mg112_0527 [Thermogutta sp.]
MLSRVLEPEVMDTLEEALDYDSMDHSEVNRVFVADFLAAGASAGTVADLGTGTALIPIELVQRHRQFEVVAVEYSRYMLLVAREHLSRLGLRDKIFLVQADAKRLPFADGAFQLVMSNSLIHHLPDPWQGLVEADRITAPGGLLFFRDLARPQNEQQLQHLVTQYAGNANAHQQQMFADSLRAALTVEEMAELVTRLGYPPTSVHMTSDRHWTWCARKPRP